MNLVMHIKKYSIYMYLLLPLLYLTVTQLLNNHKLITFTIIPSQCLAPFY